MPRKRLLLVSLTLIVVVALEASRIAGFTVPIPFAMVYATIAFAAGVGGVLTGCITAAISAHLTRYHGVFAPASPDRPRVVPRTRAAAANEHGEASATDRQRALTWAQRLKRVFAIDIEVCRRCGGKLRVIASIEERAVIERILEHLGRDTERWCQNPART